MVQTWNGSIENGESGNPGVTSPGLPGGTRRIGLKDAGYFSDGYGISSGDLIQIGNRLARIAEVDYERNAITVERKVEWADGVGVSLPYFGVAPDICAIEYFEPIPWRWFNPAFSQRSGPVDAVPEEASTVPINANSWGD